MYIFFDLETTGHSGSPHVTHDKHRIVQACFLGPNNALLNVLVHPEMHIPSASTDIHRVTDDPSRPTWGPAWTTILEWVEVQLKQKRCRGKYHDTVYLTAHNAHYFDGPVLRKECRRVGLVVPPWIKFLDTLPYFKKCYPARALRPPSSRPYNLGNLYHDLLGKELLGAHDASVDVLGLAELVAHTQIPFSSKDTQYTALPDTASFVDIKWIGLVRATRLEEYLLHRHYRPEGYKTVGDFRSCTRRWTNADMEGFLRDQLGLKTDSEVLSVVSQWRGVPPLALMYPFLESSLPRSLYLKDDEAKLIHMGIRCASDGSYMYHSVSYGDDERFIATLTTATVSDYGARRLLAYIKKMK